MEIFNEWLVFALILFGIWIVIFIINKATRREMFIVSLLTMPFGLTEPLFVPEYWSPPSLFNLAANTGFDIESLIFSFAIGGIGSVIYDAFFKLKQNKMKVQKMSTKRHNFHLLALFSPIIIFLLLLFFTRLNPIYSTSVAMFVGGIAAMLCRPDLKKETIWGGVLFLFLYSIFFISFSNIYPYAVERFWNLSALSGILILGIPLEELIFAFTFGMMWSSIYEHIRGYRA